MPAPKQRKARRNIASEFVELQKAHASLTKSVLVLAKRIVQLERKDPRRLIGFSEAQAYADIEPQNLEQIEDEGNIIG